MTRINRPLPAPGCSKCIAPSGAFSRKHIRLHPYTNTLFPTLLELSAYAVRDRRGDQQLMCALPALLRERRPDLMEGEKLYLPLPAWVHQLERSEATVDHVGIWCAKVASEPVKPAPNPAFSRPPWPRLSCRAYGGPPHRICPATSPACFSCCPSRRLLRSSRGPCSAWRARRSARSKSPMCARWPGAARQLRAGGRRPGLCRPGGRRRHRSGSRSRSSDTAAGR